MCPGCFREGPAEPGMSALEQQLDLAEIKCVTKQGWNFTHGKLSTSVNISLNPGWGFIHNELAV